MTASTSIWANTTTISKRKSRSAPASSIWQTWAVKTPRAAAGAMHRAQHRWMQRLLSKQREAEERRRQRQSEKLEAEIERLETKIAEVESQMSDEKKAADYNAMQELSSAHETLSEALETAFEQWSALQES